MIHLEGLCTAIATKSKFYDFIFAKQSFSGKLERTTDVQWTLVHNSMIKEKL